MAVAFVQGLQGNDTRFLKIGGGCKHFAGYSPVVILQSTFLDWTLWFYSYGLDFIPAYCYAIP